MDFMKLKRFCGILVAVVAVVGSVVGCATVFASGPLGGPKKQQIVRPVPPKAGVNVDQPPKNEQPPAEPVTPPQKPQAPRAPKANEPVKESKIPAMRPDSRPFTNLKNGNPFRPRIN